MTVGVMYSPTCWCLPCLAAWHCWSICQPRDGGDGMTCLIVVGCVLIITAIVVVAIAEAGLNQ